LSHRFASGRALAALTVGLVGLTSTACGPLEPDSDSVVRIAILADDNLFLDSPARDLVFLPLFGPTESGDEYRTGLVESAEYSADGRDAVLHLRPGIHWHDGHPVTTEDLEYSFHVLLAGAMEDCGETTVLDSLTIQVRDLDCGGDETHMPKHLTRDLDPEEVKSWDFWHHPVGNGPYKVVRYVPRTGFELEANPDYFMGEPPIKHLIVTFGTPSTALTGLMAGSVDIQIPGASAWVEALGQDSPYRPYYEFSRSWIQAALFWQNRFSLFSDVRVRRALTMAIDRRVLLQAVHHPPDIVPIVDGPWYATAMRYGHHPTPIPFAPDSARALLEEAGWTDSDEDGIRDRGGENFEFTLFMIGGNSVWETLGLLVQDYLGEVGVRAELQPLASSVLNQRVRGGAYEAVLMRNAYGLSTRWDLGWDDPLLREIEAELEFVRDPQRSAELQEARIRILQRDVPITTLYTIPAVSFVHRRIKGLSNPSWASVFKVMGQLWVDETWEGEGGESPLEEADGSEGGRLVAGSQQSPVSSNKVHK